MTDDNKPLLDPELITVAEVLERWPGSIHVFLKYQTSCAGCSMASFETLTGAASIYNLPLSSFLEDLLLTIQEDGSSSPGKSAE